MSDIIKPRVLKGFRDFLPGSEIERADLSEKLVMAFRQSGFVPIDTPVLEYAEILLGKAGGETEKQVYRFTDHGGRDVAMRFDLTVPLARFMAEHYDELELPFRRYHIAKVWRGENTQRGRYREFTQCDFDIIGVDSASADFDIVSTIVLAMKTLGVAGATVKINHRGIFNRFLSIIGAETKSADTLRIVDKLAKIGKEETGRLLEQVLGNTAKDELMEFIREDEAFGPTLERITSLAGGSNPDSDRIEQIFAMASAAGQDACLKLAPSITRGLDYYTGVVFETFLDKLPDIGSICSGGRYNNLASLYTKQDLPGVGASVGLDRLLAALDTLNHKAKPHGYTQLLVTMADSRLAPQYQAAAFLARNAGIACEVYPEARKLPLQYAYAEKKGASFALIRGIEENDRNIWLLRKLSSRTMQEYSSLEDAINAVKMG